MSIAVFNTISILDPVFRRRQLDNSSTITGPDGRSYAANAGGQNHPAGTHTMGDGKLGSHQHHHEAYHHEQGHHMSGHLIHDGGLGAHVMQPDRAPPHHARQVTRCTTGRTPSMCQPLSLRYTAAWNPAFIAAFAHAVTRSPDRGADIKVIAGESANTEIDQFISEATLLVNTMALDDLSTTTTAKSAETYTQYQMMHALCADILDRVLAVSVAQVSMILAKVAAMSAWMQVALVVAAVAAFVSVALRRVRIEGRTLTTMLYLTPENVVAKDAPRIAKFLESGGLMVDLSELVIGGGGEG
ncbi:hypothetical protein BC828DRAFT_405093 [Blastocladiella britannica]|nr:hypothetical protein BC828DRAFT_405093 [Blastocladiella britannica]